MEVVDNLRLVQEDVDSVNAIYYVDADNKKQGVYKRISDGITIYECNYLDDILHGEAKRYSEEGHIYLSEIYDHGHQTVMIKYYSNGVISEKTNYGISQNILLPNMHGPHTEYYRSGRTKHIKNYSNNSPIGITKYFFDIEGDVIQKEVNEDTKELKEYYESGILKTHVLYNVQNCYKIITHYNVDGNTTRTTNYFNNSDVQKEFIYHSNNNLKSEKTYDETGQLRFQKDYFSDGKIHKKMEYNSDGYRHGVFEVYRPNGDLVSRKTYDNGNEV